MFLQFVCLLLDNGVLQDGDVFVLDNCTVHLYGDNIGTQDFLFREHRILMITLPPYHPDFNPTELVFNTMLQRLAASRARYNCWRIPANVMMRETTFVDCMIYELDSFTYADILLFYKECGYCY